jgi:hypothetical protein
MDENYQQNSPEGVWDYFWCLEKKFKASWLLNYRGGSFYCLMLQKFVRNAKLEG